MKFTKFLLVLLCLIVLSLFFALKATAQYQYNDSLVPAPQPSTTAKAQYALGINSGQCVTTTDATVTNTFATNYVYSVAPIVTVTPVAAAANSNNIPVVISVTTSNFILKATAASLTNNWHAIGR